MPPSRMGGGVVRQPLPQRRFLQLRVGEQPLQRGILPLQVLQSLGLVGFQPTELIPPPVGESLAAPVSGGRLESRPIGWLSLRTTLNPD